MWTAGVGLQNGTEPVTLADLVLGRWREVEVHRVDLGLGGAGGESLAADFVDAEWERAVAVLDERVPAGTAVILVPDDRPSRAAGAGPTPVVVRGSPGVLLAWMLGRGGDPSWPSSHHGLDAPHRGPPPTLTDVGLTEVAISGPLLLAAAVALLAGVVSFASPCVVPLVPGYLAYLAGLVGADVPRTVPVTAGTSASSAPAPEPRSKGRWRVAGAAALFVAGFTAVFASVLLGVVWLADVLLLNQLLLQRIGGVVTIAMGLVFLGLVPALQRDVRFHLAPRAGLAGAPVLGAVFGLGWTPCLGPTLSGIVAVAVATPGDTATRGVLLVLAYCTGLGLPFVLLAVGAGKAVRAVGRLRRHVRGVQLAGGALLILVGLLLVTGLWAELIVRLQGPIAGFETAI